MLPKPHSQWIKTQSNRKKYIIYCHKLAKSVSYFKKVQGSEMSDAEKAKGGRTTSAGGKSSVCGLNRVVK